MKVAQWLLAHNYLLTALELLVEAQEAGLDGDLEPLRLSFSNPAKYPAVEVAKFREDDGT